MESGILIPACAGHACHLHVQSMLVAWFKVGSEISIPAGLVSVSAMKCGRSSVACEPNATVAEKGQADVGHPKPIGHRKSRSVRKSRSAQAKADRPKEKPIGHALNSELPLIRRNIEINI